MTPMVENSMMSSSQISITRETKRSVCKSAEPNEYPPERQNRNPDALVAHDQKGVAEVCGEGRRADGPYPRQIIGQPGRDSQ